MPLDPNLVYGFRPTAGLGPTGPQINQNALGQMQVQQAQQKMQGMNALKQIMSDPSSLDASGNPTPQTLQKVMAVDPATGMALQQNMMVQQQNQLKMQHLTSQTFQDQHKVIADAYMPIWEKYQTLTTGDHPVSPDQAAKMLSPDVAATKQRLADGGALPPNAINQLPGSFDPLQMNQFVEGSASYNEMIKQHLAQQSADRAQRRTEEAGWQVMNDPTNKDAAGNPIQYRYNSRTGEATTLDQKPYTPGGAAKLSAGVMPGAGVPTSPEEKDSAAAQAATGMPLLEIIPGYRSDAVAAREAARAGAIKKIMDETGKSASEAGTELANRTIEYKSGAKSAGQLTTMLGATKQAVSQLEFNIDKTKEALAKIPSTNLSPIINAIARGEEKWTGDPQYSSLFFFMHATALESARILAGGQASIAQLQQGAMDQAKQWANINMTPASFTAPDGVANAMLIEGQNRIDTFQKALQSQKLSGAGQVSGYGGNAPSTAPRDRTGGLPMEKTDQGVGYYTGDKPPPGISGATWDAGRKMWTVTKGGKTYAVKASPGEPGYAAPAAASASAAGGYAVPDQYKVDPDGTTYNSGKYVKRGGQIVPVQ